jgi:demethylmenaquinone methyltransferase/2-methoxy-6-polyprenyl-1,4-benzoquinol methylase
MNHAKAAYFDAQAEAPWAAEEYGPQEAPKIRRLLTEGKLHSGLSVLEPGCGTGRLTAILGDAVGLTGRVEALEISPRMVESSRRRLAGRGNIAVHHAALEEYRGEGAPFDRVVCHQVFPHFDDKPQALRRMGTLLDPSGLLVVVHFINAAEINDLHRKAGTPLEGDCLPSREEMERLFAQAGFVIDRFMDDELGYFLRARPAAAGMR